MYPNLYVMIVGHPATGKTRAISEGKRLVQTLSEFYLAPVSMTFASLVDALDRAKCGLVAKGQEATTFNSIFICVHELGAFIHKFDHEMIKGLSALYDVEPYEHERRGNSIRIRFASPQVSILCGVTPKDLLSLVPEEAWGQGFMSRFILVFSDERIIGDDFAPNVEINTTNLQADLASIANLQGQFYVTPEYHEAVKYWREEKNEEPVPSHPKLTHYAGRRRANLYKLSMVSAVNRSNTLVLTGQDFDTAMRWLLEAEMFMPDIFKAGVSNVDSQSMDEIQHFVVITDKGDGVSQQRIERFAQERVPFHSILRIIEIMERQGRIHCIGVDKRSGLRYYKSGPEPTN